MDTPQQALEALQREVNLILESTGRLFAAANNSAPEAALARASRLKQQLPVSNNRFHQALDVLDEELQFAKAVMRRDLAVARANSNVKPEVKQDDASANALSVSVKPEPEAQTKEVKTEDVATEQQASQPESATQSQPQQLKSPKKRSSPSLEDGTSLEPEAKKQAVGEEKPAASDVPPSDVKLELDTKAPEQPNTDQATEDKAPDTATFSNTGDLDSLFNDPASAGGLGGDNGDAPDFSTSADLNADFDFGSFTADLDANASNDNDNISALLPGLQDYANNTANADQDFSSIFNTDATANPTDQANNTGTGGADDQTGETQQDTAFDDFFDLTFDMNGDGAENQNGGNSFDFDFS